MKKILFCILSAALFFIACTPQQTVNENLNGTWNESLYNGDPLPSGTSTIIKFVKSGDVNGTYTITSTSKGSTTTNSGTYTIANELTITLINSDKNVSSIVFTIYARSKTALSLQDSQGILWNFEKQ